MIEDVSVEDGEALRAAMRAGGELRETATAFERLRTAMVDELLASPLANGALRERLYLGVQVLDGVRRALHEAVGAGEVANYRALLAREGLARES